MLRNYIQISFRSLRKDGLLSIINLSSLAIGISASLIIFIYVSNELSYDKFSTANRTYRLELRQKSDQSPKWAISPLDWTYKYAGRISGIQDFAHVDTYRGNTSVRIGDQEFFEDNIFRSNETIIELLDLEVGGPLSDGKLSGPKKVILSQSHAVKYFGSADPLGEFINIDGEDGFVVTGVFKMTKPSHIKPDMIVSKQIVKEDVGWFYNYIRLVPGTQPAAIEVQINEMASELQETFFNDTEYALIPMDEVYFHSKSKYQLSAGGDLTSVYVFSTIGFMILIVTLINSINLTSATLLRRSQEAAMRKVLGSAKRQLICRFLSETGMITLAAYLLAFIIAYNLLPVVNQTLGLDLSFNTSGFMVLMIALIFAVAGVIASIFPALRLTKQNLVTAVKSNKTKRAVSPLILFQFVISTVLIVGTFLVKDQLKFLRNRDLGYGTDRILFINALAPNLMSKSSEYVKRFEQHPSVLYTATSMGAPGDPAMMGNQNAWAEGMAADENIFLPLYSGDEYFVETMGLTVVAGKGFSEGANDGANGTSRSVLINEAAVRQFGWEDALGKRVKISGNDHTVIGVVSDFHFLSLQNSVGPLAISYGQNQYMMAIRMRADNVPATMKFVEEQWEAIEPNKPMDAFFLTENFDRQYAHEDRLDLILNVLTGIALVISAIGTLAMVMLMAEQRIKEIGIRKVLGASMPALLLTLNRQMIGVLLLANLIAWPVSYYLAQEWLNTFAYAIEPGFGAFVMAAVITLMVCAASLGYHSLRVARANPVDTLKCE
ncbi:MAG: FtsX-like permease family protein [Roseivirga sp.]|nr:FtsX-like permease family protein [Roseivirga sp.]